MLNLILSGLGFGSAPPNANPTGPFTYSEAVFAATHNSYSGDLDTAAAAGRPFSASVNEAVAAAGLDTMPFRNLFASATVSGERCVNPPLTLTPTPASTPPLTQSPNTVHPNPSAKPPPHPDPISRSRTPNPSPSPSPSPCTQGRNS